MIRTKNQPPGSAQNQPLKRWLKRWQRHCYSSVFGLCLLVFLHPAVTADEQLQVHWQDEFSEPEQQKLLEWIRATDSALKQLVGPLPFTRHIYFHRTDHAREPVPWAHTQRSRQQGVHFYVDPSYPLKAFKEDWTAPHELSHLVLPYLGQAQAWFAEGFASYMQFQVMTALGVIDQTEMYRRYQVRFHRAARDYQQQPALRTLPFAQAAGDLRRRYQYPTMYWGGAVLFWQADRWLKAHAQLDLTAVLRRFVKCCRSSVRGLDALIQQLDELAQQPVFSARLEAFRTVPGFPDYQQTPEHPSIDVK